MVFVHTYSYQSPANKLINNKKKKIIHPNNYIYLSTIYDQYFYFWKKNTLHCGLKGTI